MSGLRCRRMVDSPCPPYDGWVPSTPSGETRVALTAEPLAVGELYDWVVRPDCGAAVVFSGTVRDHSHGRPNVTSLEYEAYEDQVESRLWAVADALRDRWPDVRRVALVHRLGALAVGESSVVVAASSPHRETAFDAARFGIDALKSTVPIWKREVWDGGSDWAQQCEEVAELDDLLDGLDSRTETAR